MPEFKKITSQSKAFEIQAGTSDEENTVLRVRNAAGASVFEVDNTGAFPVGGSGGVGSPEFQLASATLAGATTVPLKYRPPSLGIGSIIAIDTYTTEAELRRITGVSGNSVTVSALTYAHAADDLVFLAPLGLIPWSWWGGKPTGDTADATTNVTAFNRLTAAITALPAPWEGYGIFIDPGTFYVNNELKHENPQALVGMNPDSPPAKSKLNNVAAASAFVHHTLSNTQPSPDVISKCFSPAPICDSRCTP